MTELNEVIAEMGLTDEVDSLPDDEATIEPQVSWCPRRECRTCGMKRSAPCSTVCRVHDLRTKQEERTYPMQTAP